MTTPATAAGPSTKHGRYVLTLSRLHNFPAFDVTDILAIEAEARQQERDERLNHEFVPCECVDLMGNRTHCLFCGATHAKYILDAPEAQP